MNRYSRSERPLLIVFCAAASTTVMSAPSLGQLCDFAWSDQFPLGDLNGAVFALLPFDPDADGPNAPNLIVGGTFTSSGSILASRVARWDGQMWSALGAGLNSAPSDFEAFDEDGDGPNPPLLFAGGFFTMAGGAPASRIARWDGAAWSSVGGGITSPAQDASVSELAVFDPDAGGPLPAQLIAGGFFFAAGGVDAENIAAWDGSNWSALGTGTNGTVTALAVFDEDADGPNLPVLIVGGFFSLAGGAAVSNIARWDGTAWSALGAGTNAVVAELHVFDEDAPGPGEPALFAGGSFAMAGGQTVNQIARWDGTAWSPVGGGVGGIAPGVSTLATHDLDGPGPAPPALYVGGSFSTAGGVPASNIAGWDGTNWFALSTGTDSLVRAVASFDQDGNGPGVPALVAGGFFAMAGDVVVNRIAQWSGTEWSSFGTGLGMNGDVNALTFFDEDGGGPSPALLFAGGAFTRAGPAAANRIARWDGDTWTTLGSGVDNHVNALTVFDADADGPAQSVLVAGGSFLNAGGMPANRVATWDGALWVPLGSGTNGTVSSVLPFDADGDGPLAPTLVVGGSFDMAGGGAALRIARWTPGEPGSWMSIGTGLGISGQSVNALAAFDPDGTEGASPPILVAGGSFTTPALRIAQWNGANWLPLGIGTGGTVLALAVYDEPDANPPALFVGGIFTGAGGVTTTGIARWNGTNWSAVGGGMNNTVISLTLFDEDGPTGAPPSLIAGGVFTLAGGNPANRVAHWDGSVWSPLAGGVSAHVLALAGASLPGDGPAPPELFAGGMFTIADGMPSARIARWTTTADLLPGNCDGGCDVGLDDHAQLAECLSGPTMPASAGCACSDADSDADVDLADVRLVQNAFGF